MESSLRLVFILAVVIFMLAVCDAETPGVGNYRNVLGKGRFKLHVELKSYANAEKVCAGEEAHLAVPTSKEINDALLDILRSVDTELAFIGVNDIAEEGKMVTWKGELFSKVGFSSWSFHEPNDANGVEDCVVIDWNGLLNDVGCKLVHAFFCEKDRLFPHHPY